MIEETHDDKEPQAAVETTSAAQTAAETAAETAAKTAATATETATTPEQLHNLKQQAVSSVFWRIFEVGGRQLIQLGISIVLARLILPESFGAIAMLTIFTDIAGCFIDSGFSTALIRKTNRTEADCCTVYWFNIVVSSICYVILFIAAPWIADFYNMPILKWVLRINSLSIILSSFAGVQGTLMSANMQFKLLAKLSIVSLIVSGAVGMTMAFYDFQVWALVAQGLTSTVIRTGYIFFKSPWRPKFLFSRDSFKEFFAFGSKLLASSLLNTGYNNIYGVVIGKAYSASQLAYYNRSHSLAQMTSVVPNSILGSVTFPTLCKLQDNDNTLRDGYRRMLRISSFIIFPLCLGLGAVAYPLIHTLYTDTWIFAASLLQIIVFYMMWYPIHAINLNLLEVKGRSDLFFRLEVIKKIVGVIMLCITVPIGLKAMCYGGIVSCFISLFLNTHYTGKLLNLGFFTQLKDYWPSLLLSVVMFVIVSTLARIMGNSMLSLIVCIAVGVVFYLGAAIIFRMPELDELKRLRK